LASSMTRSSMNPLALVPTVDAVALVSAIHAYWMWDDSGSPCRCTPRRTFTEV
jgi:hypothetical protein